ncbi:MAG: methylated-DNA--[protein]-cysteine S-methyltransferase [Actinomycetia bacterium]|nr:methylated-DNA--[protein]-cysteine S-methyltransferase [Actinomycetes bacterium]
MPGPRLCRATVPVAGHPYTVLVDLADGAVVAGGFCPAEELFARLGSTERQDVPSAADLPAVPENHPVLDALRRYAAGQLDALDETPVRQPATPFYAEVHAALRRIPPGETWSYAELATAAGRPAAVRAAGGGCASNRVALIVPCHRVLAAGRKLGGYVYGANVKAALLEHERG